ncbi:CDP-glycerol glycerophosphotransferase family protein [Selenomonas ruminantium]|uniref:CDP-glycerol glycerophosphotransferase n=1 Tax=Selenomonas ruminantium TaxID=971 RepID=A0A1H3WP34_SELRU|nr:CDP-glycerol glycerophosphotransferase family protein [Selenomonas ruminantium]SDZ88896.1 CDP-glycerol glycerophosphotransferase [Selenomonas ruminantium]
MHRIKEFVKRHKWVYTLYFYIMSFMVNFMKFFLKTDEKLILFVSYGGRHYSDSPRVIYEAMLRDDRFKGYRLVWAFVHPNKYDVSNKVRIDSIDYFKTALKARCWITNVMVERALAFKGINTYYFFTTHGILVKCGEPNSKNQLFASKIGFQYDCCLSQSEYEKNIEMKMFGLTQDKIKVVGYPKDDILVNHTIEYRNELRKKFNIPDGKKAILYAPTFREDLDLRESFEMHISEWEKELSEEYVLIYRAHPVVSFKEKENSEFFCDESAYECVEDLMIASDLLVSDYSGVIFDYCIMHKPIYLWTYDYDEYQKRRGLYFDIRQELPSSYSEQEIIQMIKKHDWSRSPQPVVEFQKKYETVFGEGTKNSLNLIYDNIAK